MNVLSYLGLGIMHENHNMLCQDHLGYTCPPDSKNTVLAISDGASQAQYGGEAAALNVRAVNELFAELPLEEFLRQDPDEQKRSILQRCQLLLVEDAQKRDCQDLGHYSATLLFAVIGEQQLLVGHVGDGAIFCLDEQQNAVFCSDPDNLENKSNRTHFTIAPDAVQHLRLQVFRLDELPVSNILLTSDGAYSMLRRRGDGEAKKTAAELAKYVHGNLVQTNEMLANVLNAMTAQPADRMDDWSVLVYDTEQENLFQQIPQPESQLERERKKLQAEREQPSRSADTSTPPERLVQPVQEPPAEPAADDRKPERPAQEKPQAAAGQEKPAAPNEYDDGIDLSQYPTGWQSLQTFLNTRKSGCLTDGQMVELILKIMECAMQANEAGVYIPIRPENVQIQWDGRQYRCRLFLAPQMILATPRIRYRAGRVRRYAVMPRARAEQNQCSSVAAMYEYLRKNYSGEKQDSVPDRRCIAAVEKIMRINSQYARCNMRQMYNALRSVWKNGGML